MQNSQNRQPVSAPHIPSNLAVSGTTVPEVQSQIISYFSEISGNLKFKWSARKLHSRFDYGCRQVQEYNAIRETDIESAEGYLHF